MYFNSLKYITTYMDAVKIKIKNIHIIFFICSVLDKLTSYKFFKL